MSNQQDGDSTPDDPDAKPKDASFFDSFIDSIDDTLGEHIEEHFGVSLAEIRSAVEDGDPTDRDDTELQKGPVVHPTDDKVVELALEALIDKKQREKAKRTLEEIEDHRDLKVEIDIDDPYQMLHAYSRALYEKGDDLVGYLHENSLFEVSGPTLEDDDEELITYLVDERDDEFENLDRDHGPRPAAFLGGAKPLRLNLAEMQGLSHDEREIVRLAHAAAARMNGYDRHLLLDEVLIIPRSDPGKNPYIDE